MVAADGPILLIPMTPNSLNQEKEDNNLCVSYMTLRKVITDLSSSCLLVLLLVKLCSKHYRVIFMSPKT